MFFIVSILCCHIPETAFSKLYTGLSMNTLITVCGAPCTDYQETPLMTAGIIICETPEFDAATMTTPCLIEYTDLARGNRKNPRNFNFNFNGALTPTITGMSANKGGTAGGTTLTISGSGFGTDHATTTVTITNMIEVPKIPSGTCVVDIAQSDDSTIVCVTTSSTKGSL